VSALPVKVVVAGSAAAEAEVEAHVVVRMAAEAEVAIVAKVAAGVNSARLSSQ